MLSIYRQATYWALSMSAIFTYRTLEHYDHASEMLLYYGAPLLALIAFQHDFARTVMKDEKYWWHQIPYHASVGLGLVALGYAAEAVDTFWLRDLEEQVQNRQALIHALLAFSVLAELEYCVNGQPDHLYLHKWKNLMRPTKDSGVSSLALHYKRDPANRLEWSDAFEALLSGVDFLLWGCAQFITAAIVRLVWFGDLPELAPFPVRAMTVALTKDVYPVARVGYLPSYALLVLLFAPMRLATETAVKLIYDALVSLRRSGKEGRVMVGVADLGQISR